MPAGWISQRWTKRSLGVTKFCVLLIVGNVDTAIVILVIKDASDIHLIHLCLQVKSLIVEEIRRVRQGDRTILEEGKKIRRRRYRDESPACRNTRNNLRCFDFPL